MVGRSPQMSRQTQRRHNGIKLPISLQQELGLQGDNGYSQPKKRLRRSQVANRKERRKSLRVERHHTSIRREQNRIDQDFSSAADDSEHGSHEETISTAQVKPPATKRLTDEEDFPTPKCKSIANRAVRRLPSPEPSEDDESDSSRASSPGLVLDPNSASFRKHAEEDDAEIAALERRLGLKGKDTLGLGDDMLDFVLDGLDSKDNARKRKREGQSWLDKKRQKSASEQEELTRSEQDRSDQEILESSSDQDIIDGVEEQNSLNIDKVHKEHSKIQNHTSNPDLSDEDDFSGFQSDDDEDDIPVPSKRVRENPYVAPIAPENGQSKYIPPSLRKRRESDSSGLEILRRQLQGQLNKLSEANMISILGEVEKLYRTNPRQDVTTVLIDLILMSFSVRSALQNTFIILHAAFLAAVYKVIGTDFGAEMLARLVEKFDQEHAPEGVGKEALNLISLLANLFTFNVVSSGIVYDHIRLLLHDFHEVNAELLLRVVRDCGPQLRSDNPSALQSIVQMMQTILSDMIKSGQTINTRTQVMIDTITDLKNNRAKSTANAAVSTGEHITRMRKALGSLNNRTLKATEPLRITRDDIANSDKKGKWWLVGASWKGSEGQKQQQNQTYEFGADAGTNEQEMEQDEGEVDFLTLARQYRMNTDVRRSIFVAIMSASDCRDAQTRLLKLRLSTKQEQEIAKVLLRCARAEPVYNPYYALLAKNLCKDNKKVRMGFQFSLWDFFKRMGEKPDEESDDEGDDSTVEMHEIVNIAKMYAYLIFHDHLSIGILKTLNIGFSKEQATMFLEVLLITIMTQPKADEEAMVKVFHRAVDTPQMVKSLGYFIKKNVRKSDLVAKRDRERVREGCRVAQLTLDMIDSAERA